MSSTALQSAPHTTATSVATLTPPLVASSPSSSGRPHNQYQQQQFHQQHHHHQQSTPSPARDPYHAAIQNSTSSSSSASKRPTRKYSDGPNKGDVPSQSNSPMSSRAALASPIPVNTSYDRPASSDRRKDMPTAVPPRSSSQQVPSGSGNGPTARKSSQNGGNGGGSSRSNGQASGSSSQSYQDERSRRSGYPTGQDQSQPKTSSSSNQRDGSSRQTNPPVSMPVRTHSTTSTTPAGPSREASEILNSMVVSQPEEDIGRERERAALTQPNQSGPLDEAAPMVNAPNEQHHGEESRRGGRSRHDFSKREKHTKFGEYILGNTIGEGEFGKVKLGWKQEGGVQVSYMCPFHLSAS